MGVTGSYNARTKVRYAYETTYEYDESKGRKVQRRRCVGHFDPETGEVVPNGRRGPGRVADAPARGRGKAAAAGAGTEGISEVVSECEALARTLSDLEGRVGLILERLRAME